MTTERREPPARWGYGWSVTTDNQAVASYPGAVVLGAPAGADLGPGSLNAAGLYIGGVAVLAGGTPPGGIPGQVQINAGGVFGGINTTGSGNAVLATSPALVTPNIGAANAASLTASGAVSAASLAVSGAAATGVLTVTGNNLALNATPAGGTQLTISTDPGQYKTIYFDNTGTSARWTLGTDIIAESGGNAGTGFNISRWSDAGAYIDPTLSINRATGAITIPHGLTGNTTGASAAAGIIGEVITASANATIVTGTPKTIVSATVSSGVYLMMMSAYFTANGATFTQVYGWIGNTNNSTTGTYANMLMQVPFGAGSNQAINVGPVLQSFSSTTTIYGEVNGNFSGGTGPNVGVTVQLLRVF